MDIGVFDLVLDTGEMDSDGVFTMDAMVADHPSPETEGYDGDDGELISSAEYIDKELLEITDYFVQAGDELDWDSMEADVLEATNVVTADMQTQGGGVARAIPAANERSASDPVAMSTEVNERDGHDGIAHSNHVDAGGDAGLQSELNLKFIDSHRNKNTTRKIDQSFRRFQLWLNAKGIEASDDYLLEMEPVLLDQQLGGFIIDLKGKNSDVSVYNYEPDTLTSYFRGVAKKMENLGYGYDIMKDTVFKTSRNVLAAKRRGLKKEGKGNKPNKAECLSDDDESQLWEKGVLGFHCPESLLNLVWYSTTKLLGFRGNHEARQLRWGDFTCIYEENGEDISHIEWNERETKTRSGNSTHHRAFVPKLFPNVNNPEKCPVRAFKLYQSKRPSAMCKPDSPFYIAINYNRPHESSAWFKSSPMGMDTIGKFMSRMSLKAGLSGRFTNHSVRRTMCTQLLQAGVAPVMIAQLSGHKNPNSLSHYVSASKIQQQHMSSVLQGESNLSAPPSIQSVNAPSLAVVQATPPKQARQNSVSTLNTATLRQGMFTGASFNGPVQITINECSH